jgi:hypothetical protein
MSKRPDPKHMTNSKRVQRIEHLKKRIAEDKKEMSILTEETIADLKS